MNARSGKMRAQSLWLWWKIFFGIFAAAGLVISVFIPVTSFGELLMGTALCMLLALAADLLCYFVIFRAMFRKSRRRLEEYTQIIAREGIGRTAHDFARREYERCMAAKAAQKNGSAGGRSARAGNWDDPEYWSMELAQAMLAEGDAKGAAELLRRTDMSFYLENARYEAFQPAVFKYYSLLLSADMSMGDKTAADSDYSRALPFLEGLEKGVLSQNASLIRGEYLIFSERFDEAEAMLEGISSSDRNIMLSKYILSGQLYTALGNSYRAGEELNKALGLCPPEKLREHIENQLEKLKNNN